MLFISPLLFLAAVWNASIAVASDPRAVHSARAAETRDATSYVLLKAHPSGVKAADLSNSNTRSHGDKGCQDHRVVSYFAYYNDDNNQHISPLPLIDEDSTVTHLILFVSDLHTKASGQPPLTIGGPAPENTTVLGPLWEEVAQIQSRGVKVLASFGGAGALSYIYLEHNFDYWYPFLRDFLKKYSLDGLDLDIEPGPSNQTAGIDTILQLISTVRTDFSEDFLITMAPVAQDLTDYPVEYSGFDYKELDSRAIHKTTGVKQIDFFNGQFYNGYGLCNSTKTYDDVVSAGFDPSRVVMGVLTAESLGNDFCEIGQLEKTVKKLAKRYPTFGGVGESCFPNTSH